MFTYQLAILWLSLLLEVALLVGLFVSGRARSCLSFPGTSHR